jgi:hypothetical protein
VTRLFAFFLVAALAVGCTTVRETQPARTATEQFILSHAVIAAARQIQADAVAGKKVKLDLTYLKTVDVEFAQGELRDRLLKLGAELVEDAGTAEIIVEARSLGLGIDDSKTFIGLPAIPIPIPGVGMFKTPALPVFEYDKKHGKAGFSITGIEAATGKHVFSVGPVLGNAVHSDFRFIGIPLYKNRKYLDDRTQLLVR